MVQDCCISAAATALGYVGGLLAGPLTLVYDILTLIPARMRPLKNIRGDIAVVTGGAGGLGSAMCLELAKQGCHLAVVDINFVGAQAVADRLGRDHVDIKVRAYGVDITQREAVMQLKSDIERDFEQAPAILINNAAVLITKKLLKPEPEELQRMINVNLTAQFWMIEAFLPGMQEQQRGHIVAISSIAGLLPLGLSHLPIYSSTKYGIRGLMRCLRISLKMDRQFERIRTTIVYPFFMDTNERVSKVFVKTGIKSVLTGIKSQDAARQVVRAIQRNKEEIVMPSFFGLLARILELTPLPISDWVVMQMQRPLADRLKKYRLQRQKDTLLPVSPASEPDE